MKVIFLIFTIVFFSNTYAQKVFSTEYDYQADLKVFVTKYDYQADLLVYKVENDYQAVEDGFWFFTDYDYQAAKKIFLLIMITSLT